MNTSINTSNPVITAAPDFSVLRTGSKADLYEATADWFEKHPDQWTRFSLHHVIQGKDCFCAVGGMSACMTDPPKPRLLTFEERRLLSADPDGHEAESSYLNSFRDLESEASALFSGRPLGIVDLNDSSTTVQQVIDALRKVAAAIRVKDGTAPTVPNIPKRTGKQFSKDYQPSAESKAKVMAHVYRKRLLKLADVTEAKEAEGRFYFGSYAGGPDNQSAATGWLGKQNLSCGTSACAMGWGATIPSFRKLGLRLLPTFKFNSGAVGAKVCLVGHEDGTQDVAADVFAGMTLFGIEDYEYMVLFSPGWQTTYRQRLNSDLGISLEPTHNKSTGKEIAARIRQFANAKFPARK